MFGVRQGIFMKLIFMIAFPTVVGWCFTITGLADCLELVCDLYNKIMLYMY